MMDKQFSISYQKPAPLDEQETIITYDKAMKEWRVYTNNPTHARKYENSVTAGTNFQNSKTYHSDTGELIAIEGVINGSVSIRKKMILSSEEIARRAEHMKQLVSTTSEQHAL